MRGSYTPPELVPENQGFPIWRNDFGAKNGAQAKRRVEAYLHTRKSTVIRSRQKTNLPHERFYTPPELVPENQGSRFDAILLDAEQGRHGPPVMERAKPLTPIASQ